MRRSTFLKHIKNLEEEDLREELKLLYDKVKEVKQFYMMEIGSAEDRSKRYKKGKDEITAKFRTKSYRKPRRPRIQKINKIVSELKKISVFNYEMIDVYLFCTETGLNFMKEYRFDSIPLNNLISKSFDKAIDLILECKMENDFKERCSAISKSAKRYYEVSPLIAFSYNRIYK